MGLKSEFKAAFKDGWLLVAGIFGAWSILNLLGLELEWEQLKRLAIAYDELLNWAWSHVTFVEIPRLAQQLIALVIIYIIIAIRVYFGSPESKIIISDENTKKVTPKTIIGPMVIFIPIVLISMLIINNHISGQIDIIPETEHALLTYLIVFALSVPVLVAVCVIFTYRFRGYIATILAFIFIIALDRFVALLNSLIVGQSIATF